MAITEREKAIAVLRKERKTALHDNVWAFDYAISSLKTDLKYDLIYEDEDVYTKADMVAMLTEIQFEIEEKQFLESSCSFMDKTEEKNYAVYTDDISKVIQQKINALKADGRTEEC